MKKHPLYGGRLSSVLEGCKVSVASKSINTQGPSFSVTGPISDELFVILTLGYSGLAGLITRWLTVISRWPCFCHCTKSTGVQCLSLNHTNWAHGVQIDTSSSFLKQNVKGVQVLPCNGPADFWLAQVHWGAAASTWSSCLQKSHFAPVADTDCRRPEYGSDSPARPGAQPAGHRTPPSDCSAVALLGRYPLLWHHLYKEKRKPNIIV